MPTVSTNFFEVVLEKDSISLNYFEFRNVEHLSGLRQENSNGFFLGSKEKIFFWGNYQDTSANLIEIHKESDFYLFSKIIAEFILKQFFQDKIKFRVYKKLHVYTVIFQNDPISHNEFTGLELYKTFHIHFAPLFVKNTIKLGFTISTSITEKITYEKNDFVDEGIEYEDLKFNDETNEVLTNTKSKYRLASYYDYSSELKNKLDLLNSMQNEIEDINNFVDVYIKSNILSFCYPDDLKIKEIREINFDLSNSEVEFKNNILDIPERYFYKGKYPRFANNYNNRQKIGYNKPFAYDAFEGREINIKIILPGEHYNATLNFFKYIKKELSNTFSIKEDKIKAVGKKIDNFSLKSYQKVLNDIGSADLVIIIIDESHKGLSPNQSPYYFCKSEFIKRGINTQEILIQQIEKFLLDKKNLKANYTDHNLALNIYAKLGGMAWTIKPNEPKNELVIGIGSTLDLLGQPILGLTSVFRGDGKYLFGKVASVTNMENYQKNLEDILTETINSTIKEGLLDVEKPFYLVFHIFKPAGKDNEIKALNNVIKKFSKYTFDYTFVHIGDGHNYRFFTYDIVNGKKSFALKQGRGQNIRGTLIYVNDKLAFLGLRPTSSVFFKIDIHKYSSVIDLQYISNQIFQFAEMSHTSYNKSGTPITLKYPGLMASFAQKLNEVNGFYLDEISMPDNSLWFI